MRYFKDTEGFFFLLWEKSTVLLQLRMITLKNRDLSLSILKSPSFENVSECTMTILHFWYALDFFWTPQYLACCFLLSSLILFYYSLILFGCTWKTNLFFSANRKSPKYDRGMLSVFLQRGYQEKLNRKEIIRKGKLQIMGFKKINWQDFSFVQSLYITQSEWHCSVT